MGIPVLILGESGSGKSASMRNFDPEEVSVFNVASKPLPFRKKLPKADGATYNTIISGLKQSKKKAFVIDDSQYLLCFDMFARAKDIGYQKFTDMALSFYNLIQFVINGTAPDVIVYFLHHVETTADGKLKAKTIGKMLDEKLTELHITRLFPDLISPKRKPLLLTTASIFCVLICSQEQRMLAIKNSRIWRCRSTTLYSTS